MRGPRVAATRWEARRGNTRIAPRGARFLGKRHAHRQRSQQRTRDVHRLLVRLTAERGVAVRPAGWLRGQATLTPQTMSSRVFTRIRGVDSINETHYGRGKRGMTARARHRSTVRTPWCGCGHAAICFAACRHSRLTHEPQRCRVTLLRTGREARRAQNVTRDKNTGAPHHVFALGLLSTRFMRSASVDTATEAKSAKRIFGRGA